MSACRYVQGKCLGLGVRGISPREDRSCPGPKGGEFTTPAPTNETKPAAPEAREEIKTMPKGERSQVGECQNCHAKEAMVNPSKHYPGKLVCKKCSKAAMNRAYASRTKGQQSATKAHDAAKAKSAGPSKTPAKIALPVPAPPAPVLTRTDLLSFPAKQAARLVFSLQIPAGTTALELMDLLRSVPSTAVVEG